jgi:hypothetical protein
LRKRPRPKLGYGAKERRRRRRRRRKQQQQEPEKHTNITNFNTFLEEIRMVVGTKGFIYENSKPV